MRVIFAASLFLCASNALALDCAPENGKLLLLEQWSAEAGQYNSVNVNLKLKNTSEKAIRMIKATVRFTDPFGEKIANLALDPDISIPANSVYDERGSWSAARLAKVRPTDIEAIICVSGVLYEDGTKEVFE